jgi:hypothetical protein
MPDMLGKKRVDGRGSNILQSCEGGTLVGLDLARIPHHVGGEYGGCPPSAPLRQREVFK